MTANAAAAPVEGPKCARHPELSADGTCARCGNFYCFDERLPIHGKTYCGTCGVLPEVDYLEKFRLERWGKRDGWAWLIGVSTFLQLFLGFSLLQAGDVLSAVVSVVAAGIAVCYFLGLPFARFGLVGINFAFLILNALEDPRLAVRSIIPVLVSLSILNDTRNQLFFKVPVSPEKLKKSWNLYANNTMARRGFFMGLVGMFFPPLALIGLPCSIIGLRRVNPDGHPPIGRKGMAIAGIVTSSIGIVWGLGFLVNRVLPS